MNNAASLDEIKKMAHIFREVFGSPNGQKVLKYLEMETQKNKIIGIRSHAEYAYLQGKFDLLWTIKRLASAEEDELNALLERIEQDGI